MSNTNLTKNRITEIAQAAGVSIATVSRVTNHRNLVAQETREKVIKAAESLGYTLKQPAPKKSEHALKCILVGVPFIDDIFFGTVINGIEASAKRHGYNLIISKDLAFYKRADEALAVFDATKACGMILLRNYLPPDDMKAIARKAPVVQCCDVDTDAGVSTVGIDDALAAKRMTEYLISTGKRRIAFISSEYRIKHIRQREKGFLDALEANGLSVHPSHIIQLHDTTYDSALSATTQLFSIAERPDAVFASSDLYAAAVLKAAKNMNLAVPDDVAISGFDNTIISQISDPSITTVNQPRYQMGYIAFEQLIEQLNTPHLQPQNITLDTELVIRQST